MTPKCPRRQQAALKLRNLWDNLKRDFKQLLALDLEKHPSPAEDEKPRPEVMVIRNDTPGGEDHLDIMVTGDEQFVANGLRAVFHTFMTADVDSELRAEVLATLIMDLVEDPQHRGLVMTALRTVESAQNMKLGLRLMGASGRGPLPGGRDDLKIHGKENDLSDGIIPIAIDKSKLH
jgi:hypothetical protein